MKKTISKITTLILTVAIALAALPVDNVFAADGPLPAQGEMSNERLEKIWARQLKVYERIGKSFENTDERLAKLQGMIDKAAENGKDVAQLQAALDAYVAAQAATRPQYEALGTIITAHAGFDADGKVTDAEQAKATVKEVRDQMKTIKESMGGTFKALREAIKAFREANKPAEEPRERD